MFRPSKVFIFSLFFFLLGNSHVFAQSNGSIEGNATDEKNEPVIGAIISIYSGGIKKGGTVTDIDGNYLIRPLSAGVYELIAKYSSYKRVRVTGILVGKDHVAKVNVVFNPVVLEETTITYVKPLISGTGKENQSFGADDIKNIGCRDITKLVATSSGMVNNGRGSIPVIKAKETKELSETTKHIKEKERGIDINEERASRNVYRLDKK